MHHLSTFSKLVVLFFCLSFVWSCNSSQINEKVQEDQQVPDYHSRIQSHTHSPCDRTTNNRTASKIVKNVNVMVRSKNHLKYGDNVRIITTPPDCRTTGVVIQPKESYKARVMGFTMLRQKNGVWVTTPPEYVAFAPKNVR